MIRTAIRACLALSALAFCVSTARTDPVHAAADDVVAPKNLLKEADGLEFRFSYFPSLDRLRLLVLGAPGSS